MASNGPERRDGVGHPPAKKNWIPWIVGALVLLAILIFGLRGCDDGAEQAQVGNAGESAEVAPGAATNTTTTGALAGTDTGAFTSDGLRGYLRESGSDQTGRAFGLEQVTFDSGSSTLDAADQGSLGEVAAVLKEFPNAAVTITSYADPEGDAAANKKLAAARAVSVKNALAAAGVPAARLMTNVVGETGNAAIAANRKVELLVRR
jgi:outer membrane protein OmpA-like peptidoglycan-associated protein